MLSSYPGRSGAITITPWSTNSIGYYLQGVSTPSSNNYIAANTGVFIPFGLVEATTFTKMFWANGSAVTGNLDVGLFQEDGTLIVSAGTTAQATISTLQVVDITDTSLPRGRYYLGITSDTSAVGQKITSTILVAAGICQALGILQDTSCAPPLSTNANPATFVAYNQAFIPLCGAQGYRTFGP
jgi:hypothetical protein